jgi:hypothetical protein
MVVLKLNVRWKVELSAPLRLVETEDIEVSPPGKETPWWYED